MSGTQELGTAQQRQAWGYYGFSYGTGSSSRRDDKSTDPVGEVRYVVGWIADQMSRLNWTVEVDGDEDGWTVTLPKKEGSSEPARTISATDDDADQKVLDLIGWNSQKVKEITTNYFVAGEFDYAALKDDTWRVISVVDPKRKDVLDDAIYSFRACWPHPADPERPDAPIFGVLPVLEEMDWISRLSRSQTANRISMRGVLGVADGFSVANGGDFWKEVEDSIKAKMVDPTDVSPLILRGALELVEPSGKGMKGLTWLIPEFPFNDHLDALMEKLIKRLAYGLPIPPEIVFGLQAQSRATAFQVEENSYRAHIQPPAILVAWVATKALQLLLPDAKIKVKPDPTDLLARRNSVQDVKDAFDRGAVSYAYLREVLGIPEEKAASEEDLAILERVRNSKVGATDPANEAADEGVAASAIIASVGGPEDEPLTPEEMERLSKFLADVDNSLMMELAGATVQATERAREKLGANVRSRESLRSRVPVNVPNGRVGTHLGAQGLKDTGIPVFDITRDAMSTLEDWWTRRAEDAQSLVQNYLGTRAKANFDKDDIAKSVELLTDFMTKHVDDTIEDRDASPLPSDDRAAVLAALGGGE